ncbi:MAG: glycosyltransferase family 2 protein [Treponema sp.]|jgi:glycosyltransferase involved in cell wall biosynthesis|nr:glycosyltransferase family 2 protein [Treponema sp.]
MLTYNRKQFLECSIRSILKQDFADFEYILVDNGSTNGSGEVCEVFARGDPRIKVIHRPFGNIGSGRNAGVKAARCEYIAFIDDDDYAYPDMLSFLYGLAVGTMFYDSYILQGNLYRGLNKLRKAGRAYQKAISAADHETNEELRKKARFLCLPMPARKCVSFFRKIAAKLNTYYGYA